MPNNCFNLVVTLFSGSDHSSEGGAVWLSGGSDAGSDEEHCPVRCLWVEGLHEGQRSHINFININMSKGGSLVYISTDTHRLIMLSSTVMNIEEFYLWCVCVQGLGTDEETLIEIVCSRSNEELVDIKKVYKDSKKLLWQQIQFILWIWYLLRETGSVVIASLQTQLLLCVAVFKKDLEKDVAGDTSGNFAKLLLALVEVSKTLGFYWESGDRFKQTEHRTKMRNYS